MDPFSKTLHYQAGGQTVTLRPDAEQVAVNLRLLDDDLIGSLEAAAGSLTKVNDDLAIIPTSRLGQQLVAKLMTKGAILPVFEEGGTRLVALPEVRVEPPADPGDSAAIEKLEHWLGDHRDRVEVVTRRPGRLLLAPGSGYGPDAVSLANDISMEFDSLTASPRFLRITPRPKTSVE